MPLASKNRQRLMTFLIGSPNKTRSLRVRALTLLMTLNSMSKLKNPPSYRKMAATKKNLNLRPMSNN